MSLYEAVLFVVAEDEGINQGRGKITLTMPANYTELEKRLWEAADFPSGLILNSSLPNIPSRFWGWFFCSMLTISLPWFHRKLQPEAAGGARWVRRITRHSWALYLPETAPA